MTFLPPASQGLLKAFLLSLYNPEYINRCEVDFGFVRVTGPVRDEAIAAIEGNTLITSAGAPVFTFESEDDTIPHGGQRPYVLSGKRESYSEVEQDNLVDSMAKLSDEVEALKNQNLLLLEKIETLEGHTTHTNGGSRANGAQTNLLEDEDLVVVPFTEQDETQLTAALVLSSLSFVMCLFGMFLLLNHLYCRPGTSGGPVVEKAREGEHA